MPVEWSAEILNGSIRCGKIFVTVPCPGFYSMRKFYVQYVSILAEARAVPRYSRIRDE